MHQLPWSRRLLVPIALVALAAASWGAAALAPAPAFGTPAPQPGDQWTYAASNVTATEGLRNGAWVLRQVTFHQGGQAQAIAQDGRVVTGTLLTEERDLRASDDPEDEGRAFPVLRQHLIGRDGLVFASHEAATWGQGGVRNTIIGPDGQQQGLEARDVVRQEWRTAHDLGPLCGARHSLQGTARPADGDVKLEGTCGGLDSSLGAARLRHVGAATWNDRVVQRYAAPGVEAWLDASVPVPVRLTLGNATFDLVGYGAGEMPGSAFGVRGDLPAVTLAPRQAWGLDERGVQHVFPLSAAYAAALADAQSGVPAFLAAHSAAQVVAASSHEEVYDDSAEREVRRQWTLTWSDGKAAHSVLVEQAEPQSKPPVPALPSFVVAPLREIRFEAMEADVGPWPAPADLPADLPTVQSLLRRWEAQRTDVQDVGNAWGFRMDCGADGDACGQPRVRAWAGRDYTEWPYQVQVGLATMTAWMDDISLSAVDAAGRDVEHREAREDQTSYMQLGPIERGVPPAREPGLQAASALPLAGKTVGTLTALAALGYLLWLLVKLGPGALFTRIESHRVLEHPRRRALQDLVEANPGTHFRDILRLSGLGAGAARHHLRALVTAGQLTVIQGPRYQCFFPAGQDRRVTAVAGLLKSPVARGIVQSTGADALSGQQLAVRLGVAPGAVSYHVQRLTQAGLVTQRREGRALLVQATDLGRAAAA